MDYLKTEVIAHKSAPVEALVLCGENEGDKNMYDVFSQLSDEDCYIILDCVSSLRKRRDSLQFPYQPDLIGS